MPPEQIREYLRVRPFVPLRVFLADGSVYEIPHPELAMVTMQYLHLGLNLRADGLARGSVMCAPLHVTRIEPATLRTGDDQV